MRLGRRGISSAFQSAVTSLTAGQAAISPLASAAEGAEPDSIVPAALRSGSLWPHCCKQPQASRSALVAQQMPRSSAPPVQHPLASTAAAQHPGGHSSPSLAARAAQQQALAAATGQNAASRVVSQFASRWCKREAIFDSRQFYAAASGRFDRRASELSPTYDPSIAYGNSSAAPDGLPCSRLTSSFSRSFSASSLSIRSAVDGSVPAPSRRNGR